MGYGNGVREGDGRANGKGKERYIKWWGGGAERRNEHIVI